MVAAKVREFHLNDRDCPINYEPSGQDHLSPCIAEADVMRRRALLAAADAHAASGLAAVTGEHYAGVHWLGSFAVYLTTREGIGK